MVLNGRTRVRKSAIQRSVRCAGHGEAIPPCPLSCPLPEPASSSQLQRVRERTCTRDTQQSPLSTVLEITMSVNTARFDAVDKAPAPRVRVDPLPRPAMHLSPTQSKNTRKLTDEGVLRPVFLCRPVGLGMPSAVRLIQSPVLPTRHAAPGTVRPASRRRGHKRAPSNPCFSNGFVTHRQQRGRDAADLLKKLSRLHMRVLTQQGTRLPLARSPLRTSPPQRSHRFPQDGPRTGPLRTRARTERARDGP